MVHRRQRDRRVPVVRRGHDDRVDIGAIDHLAIIEIGIALTIFLGVELFVLVEALLVDVAHGHDLTVAFALARRHELAGHVGAPSSGTDDADVDTVIGSQHPAGALGCRSCRGPGLGGHAGAYQEFSALK